MSPRRGPPEDAAFEALVLPHLDSLHAYLARSVGSRDDGRDILQETLIKAWRAYGDYEDRGQTRAWLFTIARRALIDWTRRQGDRRRSEAVPVEGVREAGGTPHERVVATRMEQEIRRTLVALPEERRTVFLLRHHTPMTFREIADALDIPLGTATSHMHYVIKALRSALAPYTRQEPHPTSVDSDHG